MSLSFRYFGYTLLSCCFLLNCAKRGSITGGPKDETPPTLLRATPPNKSTNFSTREIKLYFDELITLDKPDQQILISPPMKNKPEIKPLGTASKTVRIKLLDTLIPNTTYTINFGNSIVDYNEKNPFEFFQYVFSTGNELDSLSFKGSVNDAFEQELADNISVFLYEQNENITDSIVYNELPRYISSTQDTTQFQFNYLKEGEYKLIALKDDNKNYKFDPKKDKIGFVEKSISIPEDSIAALTIFKEIPDFKFSRAKQISKNNFQIGYYGEISEPKVEILGSFPDTLTFETLLLKDPVKDTLNYWVKPFFEQDSLVFKVTSGKVIDTLVSRYKDQYRDSLSLNNKGTTLKLKQPFEISAATPIGKLNENLVTLFDQDTLAVAFTQKWNAFKNEIRINFPKKENTQYAIRFLPNAVEDFLGNKNNDTITYVLNTLENTAYGNLKLSFSNLPNTGQLIVQLLKSNTVEKEVILTSGNTIDFKELDPGDFNVRVITDANANGKWDTGNYLKKIQPEPIFYHEKPITVRANWDVKQDITLE